MAKELSHVSIVLFIATGALVVFLLFCFGKRQIQRFTLKSARKPHVHIGTDAPKLMRQEIQRQLNRIKDIKYEPKLVHDRCEVKPDSIKDLGISCNYKYRMLAVDAFSTIDVSLKKIDPHHVSRNASMTVRDYLTRLHHKGPLLSAELHLIHDFCAAYEHARHRPEPFGQEEYKNYIELLQALLCHLEACPAPADSQGSGSSIDRQKVVTEVIFKPDRHSPHTEIRTRIEDIPEIATEVTDSSIVFNFANQIRCRSSQSSSGEHIGLIKRDSGRSSQHSSTTTVRAMDSVEKHEMVTQRMGE